MDKKTYNYDATVIADFCKKFFSKIKYDASTSKIKEKSKEIGSGVWKTEQTLVITKNKKKLGSLTFPKTATGVGKLDVEGTEFIKIWDTLDKEKKKAEKNLVTPEKIVKSPFSEMFSHLNMFGGLEKNFNVFSHIDEAITKLGIEKVSCERQSLSSEKILSIPTLVFDNSTSEDPIESGYSGKLRNIIWAKYSKQIKQKNKDDVALSNSNFKKLNKIGSEKVEIVKIDGLPVIHYYKHRNIIVSQLNPFILFDKYEDMKKLPALFDDFFGLLKELKISKVDPSIMEKEIFVNKFLEGANSKIKSNDSVLKSRESDIKSYERSIVGWFAEIRDKTLENEYLKKSLEGKGETLFGEIDKTKKISFVKKVERTASEIKISFIPATLVVNDFERNGNPHGKRTFYLGEYTFSIRPTEIKISQNASTTVRHPHSSGDTCCFGDGDGRRKIFSLLASNQISEVAKMLWFWIKTYKTDSAYIHYSEFYDGVIKKGLPIWDEKGKVIEINDGQRIKTGEQNSITKDSSYENNHKKLGKMKVF